MASFSLSSITSSGVTISVSGIQYKTTENEDGTTETAGWINVRFFVRLKADEDDVTIDETITLYGDTSVTMTFDGLEPFTEYAANVNLYTENINTDGAWLKPGGESFTTSERETSERGTLLSIPVLDSSFPLFDWSDWPDSYASLTTEGATGYFEKECWNDIIDTLELALNEAGFMWITDGYLSASASKIIERYGDLYADAFNSVRYNIDRLTLLGWRWAYDPSFYGYVGREDFKGVDRYGDDGADEVCYSYFLELARRLNVLIQVMQAGNIVHYMSGYASVNATYDETVRVGWSAPISYSRAFQLVDYDALIRAGHSGVIRPKDAYLRTNDSGIILPGRAGIIRSRTKASAESDAIIYPSRSASIKKTISVTGTGSAVILSAFPKFINETTRVSANGYGFIRPDMHSLLNTIASASAAGILTIYPDIDRRVSGLTKVTASSVVDVHSRTSFPVIGMEKASMIEVLDVNPDTSLPVKGLTQVVGTGDAVILTGRPGWIVEDGTLSTDSDVVVRPGDGVPVIGTAEAEANGVALLLPDSSIPFTEDTGIETEGEVYIRNPSSTLFELNGDTIAIGEVNVLPETSIPVETVTQVDTSAYGGIIPGAGASAGGTGRVTMGADVKVDIAWYPPVWIAPGELLIIQAWDETNLNNGVLEVV